MRCCDNQMTLGEIIATLKRKDQDRSVTFGFDYIVVDVLKREDGETEIISEAQVEDFVSPVLNMRGDKMPISAERKEAKLEARRAANRRFQRASEIAAKDRKVRTND